MCFYSNTDVLGKNNQDIMFKYLCLILDYILGKVGGKPSKFFWWDLMNQVKSSFSTHQKYFWSTRGKNLKLLSPCLLAYFGNHHNCLHGEHEST